MSPVSGVFKARPALVLMLIALVALAGADAWLNSSAAIRSMNEAVGLALNHENVGRTWLTDAMVLTTYLGSDPVLFLLVLLFGIRRWRRGRCRDAVWLLLLFVAAIAVNFLLKELMQSPRPEFESLPAWTFVPGGYGYPSGHAMKSIAVLGGIALVTARPLATAGCALLILAIGLSRIYLGVHWANDVLGGYLFGAVLLVSAHILRSVSRARTQPVNPGGRA